MIYVVLAVPSTCS